MSSLKQRLKDFFTRKPPVEKTDITKRFDLISRVGQGSMSKVWRARDTKTGRQCALKVLDKAKTARFESRFIGLAKPTEGEVAVELDHKYIVRTYDHGITTDKEQFLVMDFVDGIGLSFLVDTQNDVMQKGRIRFIIQLGEAIQYFHRKNWIHRDICPRNVLIDREYKVQLIDFGLVVPNTANFQKPGNRTGTANYMAPELIKRQRTDQRIDIFSFSVTCYEMYTKRMPWEAEDGLTIEMMLQHINKPPDDIRDHTDQIDDEVADIIMKGLERHPDDRWPRIGDMIRSLRDAVTRVAPSTSNEDDDEDDGEDADEETT